MVRVRINFGVSDFLREWIKIQPNVVGIFEESITHIVIEHNMSPPELAAFRSGFIQMLVEELA